MLNSGPGADVALDAAAPLRLDALSGPAAVARGVIDLFAAEIAADGSAGARRHVMRLVEGAGVFPAEAGEGVALLLVGGLDSALRPPRAGDDLLALREVWIEALARAVFGPGQGWPDAATTRELSVGEALDGLAAVAWAEVEAGRLDGPGFSLRQGDPPAPLAGGLRLVAAEPTRLRFVAPPAGEAGLEAFHRAALHALRHGFQAAESEAEARMRARAEASAGAMTGALVALAATAGAAPPASSVGSPRPPGVAAFAWVAEALGAPLPGEPPPWAAERVAALAHFAGLGCRQVILREGWFTRDQGPLLGQWHESGAPIALLPGPPGRYVALDPQAGTRRAVDAKVAAEISPSANMLYAPLPEGVHSLGALARQGLAGAGGDFARIAATGLIGGALASAAPLAVGLLFESAIPDADRGAVIVLVAGLLAAALGAAAFDFVRALALLRIETRLEARLQPAMMQRLLALPARFFRDRSVGDLHDRLQALPRARRLLAGATLTSVLSLALALPSLAVIAYHGGALASVAIGLLVCGALGLGAAALGEAGPRREAARIGGRESALLLQMLQGVAKLRVSASERRLFAVWASLFAARKRASSRAAIWADARATFMAAYPTLAVMTLFLAAFARLRAGDGLTLGGFAAINAAFAQLLAGLSATSAALTSLIETAPLIDRLRPILAADPETRGLKSDPGPLIGDIELSQVSFRYAPDAPYVIEDVSLKLRHGEFVALVGPSGSGKSTLMRLLLGFETPTSGDVFYQDRPIGSLDLTALRRRIGVVLQNGRTLSGNIFENMTNGAPYTLDDAWEAARMAGLEEDIKALPMGMHTQLTEGAPALSGGQAQRLMIARALIGKPDVLMFDEATSALDNPSQAVVTASLERLGVTRLVIAHRLSTVERADRIVVLVDGRIVEQGRFEELMQRGGALAALARRQQL